MKRVWIIALRELKTYFQDKADLAFSLLLPIATFALIYGAFGGQDNFHGTASIVNEDTKGVYAQQLLDNLDKQKTLDVQMLSLPEAEDKLNRSDLTLVLVIPAGFSSNLSSGQPATLTFLQRGNGGQNGQIVASIVRGVVSELNQEFSTREQVTALLSGKDITPAQITVTTSNFLERERTNPLIAINQVAVGSKPNLINEFLPGIITMYVLFAISISAAAIVMERRNGTLERLLTTRLTIGELFTGKFIASVCRGFAQTTILLVLSYAVFQIFTPVSFVVCLLIALIFSMTCSSIGMLIASISHTQDAATWIGVFFTMAMTMLGGTFFTISKGSALYTFSKLSINGYANDAFKKLITEGGSISNIWQSIAIMVGVTVAGLLASRLLFKALPKGK